MAHVTRETEWCTLDIDTDTGVVSLVERWSYVWTLYTGQPAWTQGEKDAFEKRAAWAIHQAWSEKVRLSVAGEGAFAAAFGKAGCRLTLDIVKDMAKPQWIVIATKIPAGSYMLQFVLWQHKQIYLNSNSFDETKYTFNGANYTQTPVSHEFGHTLGPVKTPDRGDEYKLGSADQSDRESIMNAGHQVRTRHFARIVDELNQMIPGVTFKVTQP